MLKGREEAFLKLEDTVMVIKNKGKQQSKILLNSHLITKFSLGHSS